MMVVLPMILMQYCCSGVGYSPPKGWLKCFLRASLINVLLLLADCVWCQSLPLTLMAANNAVYQSLGMCACMHSDAHEGVLFAVRVLG